MGPKRAVTWKALLIEFIGFVVLSYVIYAVWEWNASNGNKLGNWLIPIGLGIASVPLLVSWLLKSMRKPEDGEPVREARPRYQIANTRWNQNLFRRVLYTAVIACIAFVALVEWFGLLRSDRPKEGQPCGLGYRWTYVGSPADPDLSCEAER